MSIQQSSRKLYQHNLRLIAKGAWRFDVATKDGVVVRTNLTPEEVAKYVTEVHLEARMKRLLPLMTPVLAQIATQRVWRVQL